MLQEQKPNLMTICLVFLSNLKFWLLDHPLHFLGNLDSKELLFFWDLYLSILSMLEMNWKIKTLANLKIKKIYMPIQVYNFYEK